MLPGAAGAWAVRHSPGGAGGAAAAPHSYVLLSAGGGTRVLATPGDELEDITETTEFATDTATIAAGAVWGGRRLVQAFPQGLRVLTGEALAQEVWARELSSVPGAALAAADIQDRFVVARLTDGGAAAWEVDSATGELQRCRGDAAAAVLAAGGGRITAATLHTDTTGWMASHVALGGSGGGGASAPAGAAPPDVYCLLARGGGACDVYALPAWRPVFRHPRLAEGEAVLASGSAARTAGGAPGGGAAAAALAPASVVDFRLESFGALSASRPELAAKLGAAPAAEAPLLVILTSESLLLVRRGEAGGGEGGRTLLLVW